jgi:energy-coupling factor transport system permease protein
MRFYRDIVLGNFMPTGSAIHRIRAWAKIIELIALIITIFFVREIIALAMMFFFSAWIVRQSNLPFRYVLRGMRPFIWLFLFIIVAHLLVVPGRPIVPFRIGFPYMTYAGLREGVLISSQVALSIMFSSILTLTTSPMELAKGVFLLLSPLRILRVPVDEIAIMVMISIRYVPLFLQEVERITRAQMARGVSCDEGGFVGRVKMALPVLVPLLANSLRRAHAIGDALTARGYGEGNEWPPRNGEVLGRDGYLSLAATAGIIGAVVVLAIIGGSF